MSAYVIAEFTIIDLAGFNEYVQRIPLLIARHAGRYLVQGAEPTAVQGERIPGRVVVLEFPGRTQAESFLAERASSDLHAIWQRTTDSTILLVDGSPNGAAG